MMAKKKPESELLKRWQKIAEFLGQPVAVVQRWARESGMPVTREGRFVVANPEELNRWLSRESGEAVHVAIESSDLAAELKRGLLYVRKQRKTRRSPNKRKKW